MTLIPDGESCYCGKKGCLDAYCSAKRLSDAAEGKQENFFNWLEQGEEEAGAFVKPCRYQLGAAAMGAALKVVETFVEKV